jgi:hypothetical protein
LSTIALSREICKAALSLVLALLNSQLLPVKIVYLPPLPQRLLRYVMQPVNLHSYIAAKEISVFV